MLKKQAYLSLMGIETWKVRDPLNDADSELRSSVPVATNRLQVEEIVKLSVKPCPVCIDKKVVFLRAVVDGKQWYWLISDFAEQGEVSLQGANGQLLAAMVKAVKGNVIEQGDLRLMDCADMPDQRCVDWLALQVRQQAPDVLIVMGLSLARLLLAAKQKNSADATAAPPLPAAMVCGEYRLFDLPMVATYHPAEILADVSLKRQVWSDLQVAMAYSAA